MVTHTIRLHEDGLTRSKPLDEETLSFILDHDPFNTQDPDLQFRYWRCEVGDLLHDQEMKEKYGEHAKRLTDFLSPANTSQVTAPHPLVERFNTKKAGIFKFGWDELQNSWDQSLAIQLYWGDVRVEVIDEVRGKLGEWVAYAWNPVHAELYLFGRDFMPTKEIMDMRTTPENRGRPSDHLITGANCGPSALAAYLNVSTAQVIDHLPIFRKKGWANPPHIKKALKAMGGEPAHVEYARMDGTSISDIAAEHGQGLAFIQYFYGKNEKISHTHWVAFDDDMFHGPVVYDVNAFSNPAYGKGNWVLLEQWDNQIEPLVRENFRKQARYKRFDGYFVRDVISID